MYYDLNVPWCSDEKELKHRLSFLAELGYNVLVVTHTLPIKLPSDISSPIQLPPQADLPERLRLLTRCTIPVTTAASIPGPRVAELRQQYDIVAVRPADEKTLLQAVTTLDTDIISLNLAVRYSFHFRPKTFSPALARGVKIELCYGANVLAGEAEQRRNVLMNAAEIVRSTRGRGIVISSEAASVLAYRGPHDVINLAGLWGLSKELGAEAVGNGARSVVAAAQLRKRSFRGAVDIVEIIMADVPEVGDAQQRDAEGPETMQQDDNVEAASEDAKTTINSKKGRAKANGKRAQEHNGPTATAHASLAKRSRR